MMPLDTDARISDFSLRIPEITKINLDKLTKHQKSRLNDQILITMAKAIHDAKFEAEAYLKEDFE